MIKIESYEEYKNIIADKVKKKYITNYFLFEEEIIRYINECKFYYESHEYNALLLYINCNQFYRLYLYTDKEARLKISVQEKPVVADIIYIANKGEPEIAQILRDSGFKDLALYKQFYIKLSDLDLPKNDLLGYRIEYATEEQIPAILSILNATFNDISNELPDRDDLKKRIEKNSVVCLISPDGKLCGCSQWDREKGTCIIKHTALVPEERGKGMGKKFRIEIMRLINAEYLKHWVAEENAIMREMNATLGYKFNGKHMLKLILC